MPVKVEGVTAGETAPTDMNTDAQLTEAERAHYEERAAIREYDGGEPRPVAEREALAEVLASRKLKLEAK